MSLGCYIEMRGLCHAAAHLPEPTPAGAATAAAGAEQRQDGTGWQRLDTLAVDLNKAHCVRHQVLRGKGRPEGSGLHDLIDGIADPGEHNLAQW